MSDRRTRAAKRAASKAAWLRRFKKAAKRLKLAALEYSAAATTDMTVPKSILDSAEIELRFAAVDYAEAAEMPK